MLKNILQYFLFAGTFFAAAAPPVAGGAGAGTGTAGDPGAGGGGSGTPGPGGAPGGQGSVGGQPQGGSPQGGQPGQPGDTGLRQLREQYESLKSKHESFEKLGFNPDQIAQFSGVYQKAFGEAQAIGRELGYPDDEIAEALAEDPIRTIDFLRHQAQTAQQDRAPQGEQDLLELVNQRVEQALGPIQQRENVRITDQANQLFESTVRQLAVDSFKAEGLDVTQIPADEMDFLMTATSEILKYDQDALKALKYEGKTASIQKAFQDARTALDKYYLARSGREKARLTPPRPGQPPRPANDGGGRKPTLDEIIDNPGVINQKYA